MLEVIWFILWGVLWSVYFILDGFDLGVGILMPFIAKTDVEKRFLYNSIGPFWDGNEVWLITAGGVTFAAFPTSYAVMFSALYLPLILLLFALILRGVAIEFRSKEESETWRGFWDQCMFIGSSLVSILLGVAFANIFMGLPIDEEGVMHGNLLTLLNPYGILGGVTFYLIFMMHGALWIANKTEGDLQTKALKYYENLWDKVVLFVVAFLVATYFATNLYVNYLHNPLLWMIPALAVVCLCMSKFQASKKNFWKAWIGSSKFILFTIMFGIIGLYPNIIPSSMSQQFSTTITNSSSSPLTLKIMLGVTLILLPLVIGYQVWAYLLFKNKVKKEDFIY